MGIIYCAHVINASTVTLVCMLILSVINNPSLFIKNIYTKYNKRI